MPATIPYNTIREAAAVGMEGPAKESFRPAVDHSMLPIRQFDQSPMLDTPAVPENRHGRCVQCARAFTPPSRAEADPQASLADGRVVEESWVAQIVRRGTR